MVKVLSLSVLVLLSNPIHADVTDEELSSIYLSYLGRSPDTEGSLFWKKSGLSKDEIIANFVKSEEYKEQIRKIYLELLKRDPDEAGLNFYVSTGVDLSTIKASISTSEEFTKNRLAAEAAGGPQWGYACDEFSNPNQKTQCQFEKCHASDGSFYGSYASRMQGPVQNQILRCPNNGCVITKYKLPEILPVWEGNETARNTERMNIPVYSCPIGTATSDNNVILRFEGSHIAMVNGTVEEYLLKKSKTVSTQPSSPGSSVEDAIKNLEKPSTPVPSLPATSNEQDKAFVNSIKSFAYKCLTENKPSPLCESLPKLVDLGYELMANEISETSQNASSVKYYTSSQSNLQSETLKSHSDILETAKASNLTKYQILKLASPDVGRESLNYSKQYASQKAKDKKKVVSTALRTYQTTVQVGSVNAGKLLSGN